MNDCSRVSIGLPLQRRVLPTKPIVPSVSRRLLLFCLVVYGSLALPAMAVGEDKAVEPAPIEVGAYRQLFVDDRLIDRLEGDARLELHHPVARELAIVHDAPWEGTGCGYHTVFHDGDLYRMYYRGWHLAVSEKGLSTGRHEMVTCYAHSKDGVRWDKPELGIVEFEGSKKNNIILKGLGTHNFTPFRDHNPDCPADARYKALGGIKHEGGLFGFKSADGLHWSLIRDEPIITDGAFDSQNLAFWDPVLGKYRAYWRIFTAGTTTAKVWKPAGYRAIRTATSDDFLSWSNQADLTYVDSPPEQLYTNQVKTYDRAPQYIIGFPARYIDRGWSDSMRSLPEPERREMRASANRRYGTALTEGLLMSSRDGVHFKRWNEAFLRPGIERPGTWQYGQQYIAWHAVETASTLPHAPAELSLYATEGYWHGEGCRLRRYSLRLDGFVSVHAPMEGGTLVTKPFVFRGDKLALNYATSAAGSLRIEVQRPDGSRIEGFGLDDCEVVFGDDVDRIVPLKGDLGSLAGQPVRLLFELRDADLYSFRFVDD